MATLVYSVEPRLDYGLRPLSLNQMRCQLCLHNIKDKKLKSDLGIICHCNRIHDFCTVEVYVLGNQIPIRRITNCALCTAQVSVKASVHLLSYTQESFNPG